ncbi:MAG: hypothetical protein ACO3JH_04665 [Flavobacteriaceae bacterium]
MPRVSQTAQRARTQDNPLELGSYNLITAVRNLKGSLGPQNKVGLNGYGGGTYNHWFKITLESPGWIILAKGGPKPQYINISAYDLNLNPIEGRNPFDKDSVSEINNGEVYYPYVGHIMGAQSDLYNTFNPDRLDRGDQRYFPLETGSYLLCVSSTRNELISYEVAFVVEFPVTSFDIVNEDYTYLLFEDDDQIEVDTIPGYVESDRHEHSLSAWETAWYSERQPSDPFPSILVPLTTQP